MITIEDLTATAGPASIPAHILRGVSLRLEQGRILGVVGESGSGKSTLALALLRLLPGITLGGRITMDGIDLLALSESAMADWRGRQIAMIFQDPATALNPLFTVGTQLTDVLRRRSPGLGRRAARAEAAAALRRVEIADPAARLGAYPHQLSGGMRQRVLIAMALAAEPVLLLADEPTTALDATVEAGIMELFQRLRTEFHGSILFISHQLGLVAQLCDEIAVMYAGAVLEHGPAAALCRAPKHPYTAALIACELEADDGPIATIPGDVPGPSETPPGCLFAARCALAEPRCHTEQQPLRALEWQVACWKAV